MNTITNQILEELEEDLTIFKAANDYYNVLSNQDIQKVCDFINKLRENTLDIQEKREFIKLIEYFADCIYADKYGTTTYYQQSKKYKDRELNYCSNLLNYLESQLCWDLDNQYDEAFSSSYSK